MPWRLNKDAAIHFCSRRRSVYTTSPHNHSCNRALRTPKGVEEKIVALRRKHPQWGARKLRVLLKKEQASIIPSSSTITAILHRYDLIAPEKSERQKLPKRFEYNTPNELWQMDFKGHFTYVPGTLLPMSTVYTQMERGK